MVDQDNERPNVDVPSLDHASMLTSALLHEEGCRLTDEYARENTRQLSLACAAASAATASTILDGLQIIVNSGGQPGDAFDYLIKLVQQGQARFERIKAMTGEEAQQQFDKMKAAAEEAGSGNAEENVRLEQTPPEGTA